MLQKHLRNPLKCISSQSAASLQLFKSQMVSFLMLFCNAVSQGEASRQALLCAIGLFWEPHQILTDTLEEQELALCTLHIRTEDAGSVNGSRRETPSQTGACKHDELVYSQLH